MLRYDLACTLLGIVGLLFFALTLAAGWAMVSKLRTVFSTLEAGAASPIVGILFATWAALLIYLVTASLDLAIIATSVLMLAVFIFLQPWKTTSLIDKKHLPGIGLSAAAASIFMLRRHAQRSMTGSTTSRSPFSETPRSTRRW